MFNLEATPQVWVTHEESGAEFLIRPILPRDNQKLMKRARDKQGNPDFVTHNGLIVDFAVIEWKKVGGKAGELPPTTENKVSLGEKFQKISNFIYERATDVRLFVDETEAAKND